MTSSLPALRRAAEVSLRNVVHLYPSSEQEVVALRGVDLDVGAGEVVALLGPSGAGKSTVLSLLAGTITASAGQVLIGGQDIGRMSGERLARLRALEVSLVVQGADRNLLPYASAEENVWVAQQGARQRGRLPLAAPKALLDRFDLVHLASTPAQRLSSGQRQLVALVAGVAPDPSLLLLDEPTSRLDPDSRDHVVSVILELCHEMDTTVILVTHDPAVAGRIGRTVTIRDGRVGAEGRRGTEYAVVGPDGSVQLPGDARETFTPGSLVEIRSTTWGLELRKADDPDR